MTPTADIDPYADEPKRWIGRRCHFLKDGKELIGVVTAQKWAGRTARGALPDYTLTVRGNSGRTMEISLVENKASFD